MKFFINDRMLRMTTTKKIYVLDDCEGTTFILKRWLSENFQVEVFNSPQDFLEKFKREKPALCILDVQLNDNRNGLDVLKEIGLAGKVKIPFIFISQGDEHHRKVNAYELGAVDYLKKPLEKNEMLHKINNIMYLLQSESLKNTIELDENNLTFTVNGSLDKQFVRLTPKEFIIFKQLFNHKDSIVTREQILAKLEDSLHEKFVVDRVIDVHVCNIKKKLGPYKDIINSVYGIGYKFETAKAS